MSICPIWNFTLYVTQSLHFFENHPFANQNSLKGVKDVTKIIDFAQASRSHTPNNTGLVRTANKSG